MKPPLAILSAGKVLAQAGVSRQLRELEGALGPGCVSSRLGLSVPCFVKKGDGLSLDSLFDYIWGKFDFGCFRLGSWGILAYAAHNKVLHDG